MGDVHLLKTEGRLLSAHEIAMLDAVRDVEAAVMAGQALSKVSNSHPHKICSI